MEPTSLMKFRQAIAQGPCQHCISCHRLLYPEALTRLTDITAMQIIKHLYELFDKDIPSISPLPQNPHICRNCRSYMDKKKKPPLSFLNELQVSELPAHGNE